MHLKGANSMTMSELSSTKALAGTGRAISVLFGYKRIGPPLPVLKVHFSAMPG